MLRIDHVTCGYGKTVTVSDINLEFGLGEIICLLGPNGVGKTTFFKSILGFIPIIEGNIFLEGRRIQSYSKKELAQKIAYVPQAHQAPFDFRVRDVIMMGRHSQMKGTIPSREDLLIVDEVMEELGMKELAGQSYMRISGGERQMVLIARVLAQGTKIIIMDEPTSNLDFGNQAKIIHVIKSLRKKDKLVIMTTHSPNQTFECGSRVLVFHQKKMFAYGKPEEVIDEEMLLNVYGVKGKVYTLGDRQSKICLAY